MEENNKLIPIQPTSLVKVSNSIAITNKLLKSIKRNIPEMVLVKGGTFQMGSEDGHDDEKPIHTVNLTDFYIGKYQITIKEYMEFVNATKSNYPVKGNLYINI